MWIFSQKVSLKLCFIRELIMERKANEICENVLYFFKKLRWNSHHIQLTILKCVIRWHSVRSWRHATITSLWFQNFSIAPKERPPTYSVLTPHFYSPHLLVALNPFFASVDLPILNVFYILKSYFYSKVLGPKGHEGKEHGSEEKGFLGLFNIYLSGPPASFLWITTTFRAQQAANQPGGKNDVHLEFQERRK